MTVIEGACSPPSVLQAAGVHNSVQRPKIPKPDPSSIEFFEKEVRPLLVKAVRLLSRPGPAVFLVAGRFPRSAAEERQPWACDHSWRRDPEPSGKIRQA